MIILGIETSCDETALALIETKDSDTNATEYRILSSLVHSQADLHSPYGGVFPTLAKREHGKNIVPLFDKLLNDAGIKIEKKQISEDSFKNSIEKFRSELQGQNPELLEAFSAAQFLRSIPQIDRIAVTEGPGLEPALWVGINFARMIGEFWNVPVVAVNHMEGHVIGSLIETDEKNKDWQKLKDLPTPSVAFLISGGHTELVKVNSVGSYEIIGQTKDDAVGEAYDKVARLLGLPYPGGPQISNLAESAIKRGLSSLTKLPRPMLHSGDINFSFSGLKTAVLYAIRDNTKPGELSDDFKASMALEFEDAVAETLDKKLRMAVEQIDAKSIIIGGGVSANNRLRRTFTKTADEYSVPIFLPSKHVSGDNALMIAIAGIQNTKTPPSQLRAHGTKRLS